MTGDFGDEHRDDRVAPGAPRDDASTPPDGGAAVPPGDGASVRPGETGVERTPGGDAFAQDDDASAQDADSVEIGRLIGRLSADEGMDRETRGRLLARLARLLGNGVRRAGAAGYARGRLLTDVLIAAGPHIPVRDLETLRAHHNGLEGEELADSLVRVASNATTAVGAAGGALAAAQFTAPPLLLTAPAQLAAETLVVAAIEVKLIAELHEVYGVRVQGSGATRAAAFLTAWGKQRGIHPLEAGSFTNALGSAAKIALRKRLMRGLGRSLSTLGPFLTGAAAGAALNRTATKRVAATVRSDLRRNAPAVPSPRAPRAELDTPAERNAGGTSAGQLPPPGPAPGPGQVPPPGPPPSDA